MTIGFGDPVELYRAESLGEAHVLCIGLMAEGISAHVDKDALGDLPGGWTNPPRVFVNRSNLTAARDILEMVLREELLRKGRERSEGVTDPCLACGKEMGDWVSCPACGWSFESASSVSVSGLAEFPLPGTDPAPNTAFRVSNPDDLRAPASEALRLPAKADVRVTDIHGDEDAVASGRGPQEEAPTRGKVNLGLIAVVLVPSVLLVWLAWFVLG